MFYAEVNLKVFYPPYKGKIWDNQGAYVYKINESLSEIDWDRHKLGILMIV